MHARIHTRPKLAPSPDHRAWLRQANKCFPKLKVKIRRKFSDCTPNPAPDLKFPKTISMHFSIFTFQKK